MKLDSLPQASAWISCGDTEKTGEVKVEWSDELASLVTQSSRDYSSRFSFFQPRYNNSF